MTLLKEETLAKKLIGKGSIVYIFMLVIAPVGYIIRVIASNTMSVQDIGLLYSILGLIGLLSIYNDLGLTEALQYFLPKYRIEKKYNNYKTIRRLTLIMQFISSLVFGIALRTAAPWLAEHYFHTSHATHILQLFSFYFLGINIIQAITSVFIAFQDVLYDKLVESIKLYSILIATIILRLTHNLSLYNLSLARLGGIRIGVIVCVVLLRYKYGHTLRQGKVVADKKTIKQQLSYAFRIFLGANASSLLGQIDQQMVIAYLGAQAAGYYSNYLSLHTIQGLIVGPMLALIFPITTELLAKHNNEKFRLLLQILYKYFSVAALCIACPLLIYGPEIASVLYGQKFSISGELMQYSAGFIITNILLAINFGILAGMGKARKRMIILVLGVIVNIAINIYTLVVLQRGIIGVIIGTVVGQIIMLAMSTHIIYQTQKFLYHRSFVGKNFVLITILGLGLRYIQPFIHLTIADTDRGGNIIRLCIAAIIYFSIIAIYNNKEIKGLRKEICIFLQQKNPKVELHTDTGLDQ